ncbi:hypothetical protein [Kineococcus radiotolerans]|uniref:Uncharacterized protein n=1 Tax=Kineococcus radiotolerans (strain ATCC BAA-149 / DSM 14245 / SRS30216) TaxID=266940 RepID=A6WGW9_KINRD|nr:hypothetical protein [Kineococcus radiotolerans]ABS06058.1 hypothetical protein Krad_4599 [Kineococcus radiotolerans SRS30216 = ATCC BAA-149]
MPATAGEYAPDDDSWEGHTERPVSDVSSDVIVVVDVGRPTAVRWRGLLLPVTHAVRWHERPVIPWWRSQRRLDLDQALALVDQERWRLHAEVPPPAPTLRKVPTDMQPGQPGGDGARGGYKGDFGGGFDTDAFDDFDEGSQDLDDLEPEHPGLEPATIVVDVLRAGDDWHVLSAEEP